MSELQHRPQLKLPSKQERRCVHRRHIRDLLDTCQLQHPLRAGYEAAALGRDPRLAEAIGVRRALCGGAPVARARRRRLCRRWWNARPGKLKFYPGVIDSPI